MNILVTGCFGFIGSNLTARLLQDGHQVVGVDNLFNPSIQPTDRIKAQAGELWKNFTFHDADVRGSLISLFINNSIDVVIHLAALGSITRSFVNPQASINVNEGGLANVAQAATRAGVKKIIFASSSSVYGNALDVIRSESSRLLPASPYGLTKKHNEEFMDIWSNATGVPYVGLRFFNVYGPGQDPRGEYAAVIPRFCLGDALYVFGDGSKIRDFTYVDDVCDALILAMSDQVTGIFNVGTGVGTSILELSELLKGDRPVKFVKDRTGETKESIASTEYAEKFLGFKAKTSLKEGLKNTVQYYRKLCTEGCFDGKGPENRRQGLRAGEQDWPREAAAHSGSERIQEGVSSGDLGRDQSTLGSHGE